MQRLQISSRPSEEFLINLSPDSSSADDLVVYDVAKKELVLHNNSYKSVNRERAVHIIPLPLWGHVSARAENLRHNSALVSSNQLGESQVCNHRSAIPRRVECSLALRLYAFYDLALEPVDGFFKILEVELGRDSGDFREETVLDPEFSSFGARPGRCGRRR
ncbi:Uncharacterized protein Rs2_05415 [Raphanus sativus]|nr:Uncharacterized protein Rs2_05415 [Raphanus sativus]